MACAPSEDSDQPEHPPNLISLCCLHENQQNDVQRSKHLPALGLTMKYEMSRLMTKPTKWHVHPVKTQISLSIHPVWSVFAVCMKKAWILSYTLNAQRRLWSGWPDAQVDLSLRWAHKSFCWFCHVAAHIHIHVYIKFVWLYKNMLICLIFISFQIVQIRHLIVHRRLQWSFQVLNSLLS